MTHPCAVNTILQTHTEEIMGEMTREEWLEERTKGMGATDCASIIVNSASPEDRVGCWKGSLFAMWSTKMKMSPPEGDISAAARRGQIMEEYVCRMYSARMGEGVELTEQGLTWHPKRKHVFGTPDRLVSLDGVRFGMDAKTRRSSAGWGEDGSSNVPLDTEIQCRVYMDIFNAPYWDVATLFGIDDFRVYRIYRDQELIDEVLDVCEDWFNKHVSGELPPSVDGSERAKSVISHMHPRIVREALRAPTPDEKDIHRALIDIRARHKALSSEKLELENKLRLMIADDIGIEGVATWKKSKDRKVFNRSLFQEENPKLYEKYTEEVSGQRTLRIIGEKK